MGAVFSDLCSRIRPIHRSQAAGKAAEIGVQNGGSLELWAKYLPEGSEIVGLDIDPAVAGLRFHGAITAHVVYITDAAAVTALLGDKMFDVIIDDGSHN